ncbi:MAG: hypothetical protein SNJ82_08430, partial [Gemmataceae bacterium]
VDTYQVDTWQCQHSIQFFEGVNLDQSQTEGTPTRREVLAERVAAIQRHSSFAQVRVEIRGRKILVFRDDSTSELADLLAQRLRDLPGVEAVEILRGDSSR